MVKSYPIPSPIIPTTTRPHIIDLTSFLLLLTIAAVLDARSVQIMAQSADDHPGSGAHVIGACTAPVMLDLGLIDPAEYCQYAFVLESSANVVDPKALLPDPDPGILVSLDLALWHLI
ncbi:unnamed protein product [Phytophthora lilii]|uniref:Unnamed protein product n=1 Tax=Phytophthora lilii TaxID=2077276 RepID=A0A9W6TCX3_9STRA|nr:unnamed protein product [Phytophthora lilii]